MDLDAESMERLIDRWPKLAGELRQALIYEGRLDLADAVDWLEVVQPCPCGDAFCQSFYTAPPPSGTYGPDHKNIPLFPPWAGMLIVDVVEDKIKFVEVLERPPLD